MALQTLHALKGEYESVKSKWFLRMAAAADSMLLAGMLAAAPWPAAAQDTQEGEPVMNGLSNGDFEQVGTNGQVPGWSPEGTAAGANVSGSVYAEGTKPVC